MTRCPACKGSGCTPGGKPCWRCKGKGEVKQLRPGRPRRMHRYIVLVHVRPEGSLGVFDPSTITVDAATNDATALAVAAAVAEERGWECQRASIIRREPVR